LTGARRRNLLLAGLVAGAALATGMVLWGNSGSDAMTKGDRQTLTASLATASLSPLRVDLDNPQQVERARASFDLPPAAADQLIANARQGNVRIAWITLRDFLDEDGDVAEITTGGLTRTVLLTNAPQMIAVPIVPGDFLRVTGMHDGSGGGVTVSVAAGGAEIKIPLDVGQTVTLPVR